MVELPVLGKFNCEANKQLMAFNESQETSSVPLEILDASTQVEICTDTKLGVEPADVLQITNELDDQEDDSQLVETVTLWDADTNPKEVPVIETETPPVRGTRLLFVDINSGMSKNTTAATVAA